MADTTFANGTVIQPDWLNDVNDFIYGNTAQSADLVNFLQSGSGAASRTVQSKLREVVSVKDFEAVGDGSTDDTTAIQAALDSGAKEIFFPPGTYRVLSKLTRPVGVRMSGLNPYYTYIEAAHNGVIVETAPASLSGDTYAGIVGLGFKNAATFNSSIAISMANVNQTTIRQVRVESGPAVGIQLVFVLNSLFDQISTPGMTSIGLYIYSSSLAVGNNRNVYSRLNFNDCAKGIRIDGTGTLQSVFSDVACETCTTYPIEVLNGSQIIFERLYLEGNTTSVQLTGGTDITFNDAQNVSAQQFINTSSFGAARVIVNRLYDLSAGGVISNAQVQVIGFGQLKFPSTQVASSDPNTLDDYEEGTWTPGDSSGAGLSFTSVSGRYTKIGRAVTAFFELTVPSTVSGATFTVGGLPFTSVGYGTVTLSYCTDSTAVRGETFDSQNYFQLYSNTGTGIANSAMSTDTMRGHITYFATT